MFNIDLFFRIFDKSTLAIIYMLFQKQLDIENCVDVASIAETYSLTSLCNKALAVMCSSLREFSTTSEFQRLTSSQLIQLLRSDHPVNCSEGEVASAVAAWLSHTSCRVREAHHLLYYINWSEVPGQILHSLALPCPLPSTVTSASPAPPKGLLNSRGLELAFVKVGGFSMSGITNEITFRLLSSKRWQHLTTIPHVEQCNFGTAVLNNQLYVVGGCFNQSLQEHIHPFSFSYDPITDKWATLSPMLRERCRFTLTVLNGKLYAVGGASEDSSQPDVECEVYSPENDSWSNIGGLTPRAQHTAAAVGRHLYVFGGLDLQLDTVLDNCYSLDTEYNVWHRVPDMLSPRADHSAIFYKGKIYICGGWNEENGNGRTLVPSIECYDPVTSLWSVVSDVPTPRYHAGIAILEDKLYVMGGFLSDATFDRATGLIECYDLDAGMWCTEPSYPKEIWEHTCVSFYVPRRRENMDVLLNLPP